MVNVGGVVLVRWPSEADRRRECRETSTPCLLVLEGDTEAPECDEFHEDWVRAPVSRKDLEARAKSIRGRLGRDSPSVDPNGVLHYRSRKVPMSSAQARLMDILVEQFETVVIRSDLESRLKPGQANATRNALDLQINRLRQRCSRVGLTIVTARGRGYMLQEAAADPALRAPDASRLGEVPPLPVAQLRRPTLGEAR